MSTYRPRPVSATLSSSATPSSSGGRRAPGPEVPITSGPFAFRRRYALLWIGLFAACWLAGFSGWSMLDL